MIRLLSLAIALSLPVSVLAQAPTEEQKVAAQKLPQTVVVRVDKRDNSVAVLESAQALEKGSEAGVQSATNFVAASATPAPTQGELDEYTSRDSWYFYWNYNYSYWYPNYYYYGYQYAYTPYYSWNYGNYYYYYCNWRY